MGNGDDVIFNFLGYVIGKNQIFIQIIFGNQMDFAIVRDVFDIKLLVTTFYHIGHFILSLIPKDPYMMFFT